MIEDLAVVIPFFQRKKEPLKKALLSISAQTYKGKIYIIIVDDGSPVPAKEILLDYSPLAQHEIILVEQENGGAGSARNKCLNHVPDHVKYVAFLDSDDSWRPHHIEKAINALSCGHDLYFSDWWSYNYPEQTNFERIQTLDVKNHQQLDGMEDIYELGMTPIEHILSDGGGVIQTSTVVFRFDRFKNLRFREEFYNGQDFFFWMDLGEMGAECVFSTMVGCDNGEGINIYQAAGWGTEKSLQRQRNELFVWTSVNRFYNLSRALKKMNMKTIRSLQKIIVRDLIFRLRRKKPILFSLLKDIIRYDPYIIVLMPVEAMKVIFEKLGKTSEA